MGNLANSEDQDEISQNAAFHQVCTVGLNKPIFGD